MQQQELGHGRRAETPRGLLRRPAAALALLAAAAAPALAGGGTLGTTDRVSLRHDGTEPQENSRWPSLTQDGRCVVFTAYDSLVPADSNVESDIYLRDRSTGALELVSTDALGIVGNSESRHGVVSGDGHWVAFESRATNLVGGAVNGYWRVYLKHLPSGAILCASRELATGLPVRGVSPSISHDGRYVAFSSISDSLVAVDTNLARDVFVYDRVADTTVCVTDGIGVEGDGDSFHASISADGGLVAFASDATNLVPGDSNGQTDVFIADIGGPISILSVPAAGGGADGPSDTPRISADGTHVAFETDATNLFPGDDNDDPDVVFVELGDTDVRPVATDATGDLSVYRSTVQGISDDGRYVLFACADHALAPGGVPGGRNLYLRDMDLDATWVVSKSSWTTELPDSDVMEAGMDGDGDVVAWTTYASNLVPGDTNAKPDVYARHLHADPVVYCGGGPTVDGCVPTVDVTGFHRVGQPAGLVIEAAGVPNQRFGALFYGFEGRTSLPFGGQTMCVKGAKRRAPIQSSGGNPGPGNDCSGTLSIDVSAFAAGALGGAPHPDLQTVGLQVNAQYWGRDPAAANGLFLTSAVEFLVSP